MSEKTKEAEPQYIITYLSGGLKLVGVVNSKSDVEAGKEVELYNVWQINQMMAPLPTGEGVSQLTILMPLPGARGAVKKIRVVPETWMFPDEAGCLDHVKELLRQVENSEQIERAKSAGIQLARPGPIQVPPR